MFLYDSGLLAAQCISTVVNFKHQKVNTWHCHKYKYLHLTDRLHLLDASPPELIATTLYSPASSRYASSITREHRSPWNSNLISVDSLTGRSLWYQITCKQHFTHQHTVHIAILLRDRRGQRTALLFFLQRTFWCFYELKNKSLFFHKNSFIVLFRKMACFGLSDLHQAIITKILKVRCNAAQIIPQA